MMLTDKNEKVMFYLHWLRLAQPEDLAQLTGFTPEYLQHLLPAMAEEAYVHKVQWARQRVNDPYAAYENGPSSRIVLRDTFGIPLARTRFRQTPRLDNTTWISHALMTTKIIVPLWEKLGEHFVPQYVSDFKADVVHNDARKRITIKPDYAFKMILPDDSELFYVEADNAGKDADGTIYKSEPLRREEIEQQSLYRKVLGYIARLRAGDRFNVLIVCRSHARASHIHTELYPLIAARFPHLLDKENNFIYKDNILVNYLKLHQNAPTESWCNFAGGSASL